MSDQELLKDIVRQIEELKTEQRRLLAITPVFEVWNQAEQQNLTADQNNYALGDYSIISLTPTANRTIRGITGGVRGRPLMIRNDSASFTITFTNQDALATAENRIVTASAANVILGVRQTAIFYYVIYTGVTSRWNLVFPIA